MTASLTLPYLLSNRDSKFDEAYRLIVNEGSSTIFYSIDIANISKSGTQKCFAFLSFIAIYIESIL